MLGRREENRRDDEQIPRWWSDETHALSSCRRYGVHACSIARSQQSQALFSRSLYSSSAPQRRRQTRE